MTSPNPALDDVVDLGNERAKAALRQVIRYRGLNNSTLADIVGMSRQTVQTYTTGGSRPTAGILEAFGQALNVPGWVLAMEPDEALKWTLEHAPNPADSVAHLKDRRRYRKTVHEQVFSRKACIGDDVPHMGESGGASVVHLHQFKQHERAIAGLALAG
jgi:transcriptional regulator with XRE-family HTH domain